MGRKESNETNKTGVVMRAQSSIIVNESYITGLDNQNISAVNYKYFLSHNF